MAAVLAPIGALFAGAGATTAFASTVGALALGTAGLVGSQLIGGALRPKVPKVPGAPSIDQARVAANEEDLIRRRRGVLTNIYGGNLGQSAPTVATKQLLGG